MYDAEVISILKNYYGVEEINKRNYWLIRTEAGNYYQDFSLHNYVAIGWDYVNIKSIQKESEKTIKKLIRQNEESTIITKQQISSIYNKLQRFVGEIKKGDIIIIPSENSDHISIGIAEDDDAYENYNYIKEYGNTNMQLCSYAKRRNVKWVISGMKSSKDIYLQQMLYSHHAIYKINVYEQFIDRNIYPIYIKDNIIHLTVRAKNHKGLSLKEWTSLIDFLNGILTDYSKELSLDVNLDDIQIKANVHSPGLFEIIGSIAGGCIGVAVLVFALNHIISGGKLKGNIKIPTKNGVIEGSIDGESEGLLGRLIQMREIKQKHKEKLIELESAGIKFPELTEPK